MRFLQYLEKSMNLNVSMNKPLEVHPHFRYAVHRTIVHHWSTGRDWVCSVRSTGRIFKVFNFNPMLSGSGSIYKCAPRIKYSYPSEYKRLTLDTAPAASRVICRVMPRADVSPAVYACVPCLSHTKIASANDVIPSATCGRFYVLVRYSSSQSQTSEDAYPFMM